ncbi:MAG: chemotaxis protein CheX [Phycisphaerae bacterium]|nr:chemotaxis protein CheX [Phycisphaerae bacterium]
MNVRYINLFVDAVRSVFHEMMGVDVLLGSPHLRAKDSPPADVSAIFGFTGDVTGSAAICMSNRAAQTVATKIHGAEIGVDYAAFGQILSGVAGRIAEQARLRLGGFGIAVSIPRIIVGERHRIVEPNETAAISLPCDSPLGRFSIEAAVLRRHSENAAETKPPIAAITAKGNKHAREITDLSLGEVDRLPLA